MKRSYAIWSHLSRLAFITAMRLAFDIPIFNIDTMAGIGTLRELERILARLGRLPAEIIRVIAVEVRKAWRPPQIWVPTDDLIRDPESSHLVSGTWHYRRFNAKRYPNRYQIR